MEKASKSGPCRRGDIRDAKPADRTEINEGDDLSKANLGGSDLSNRNLRKVVFSGASLQKVDLSKANLDGAKFDAANLKEALLFDAILEDADFSNASLEKADLRNAQLNRAVLRQANMSEAKLWYASFQNADLQDADLTGVSGLSARQLAGANVSGAKLPEDIHKFESLVYVDELSKHGQKMLLAMLLGCVYAWLTIGTTTSANLLINSASSPLPIIGAKIPIVGFYWIAPVLLFCTYLWFQLYLLRLWKGFAAMPAFFPDGNALHEKTYPWLLNSLVTSHFFRLRNNRPTLSRLEVGLCILLAYWTVPLSILLLWERYLARHDWLGTLFQTGILSVAIMTAIVFHRLAVKTLRGKDEVPFDWKKAFQDPRTLKRGVMVLATFGFGLIFYALAYFCIEGNRPDYDVKTISDVMKKPLKGSQDLKIPEALKILIPRIFELIAHVPFANIDHQDISMKPAEWSEKIPGQIERVKGADLRRRDLRWVYGGGAFLVKANLESADLRNARFTEANLQKAILDSAKLQNASLASADLSEAQFSNADLSSANLEYAFLQRAKLRDAKLMEVNMVGAQLVEAHLFRADFCGADLTEADLSGSLAFKANFTGANLFEANLSGANLAGANLAGANLSEADISGVLRWENIKSIEGANIYEVKNAPEGFVAWAMKHNALSLNKEDWEAFNEEEKTPCLQTSSESP